MKISEYRKELGNRRNEYLDAVRWLQSKYSREEIKRFLDEGYVPHVIRSYFYEKKTTFGLTEAIKIFMASVGEWKF